MFKELLKATVAPQLPSGESVLIPRKDVADFEGVTVRTIERFQKTKPNFPKAIIRNGRHFFDLAEYRAYRRQLAANPEVSRRPQRESPEAA